MEGDLRHPETLTKMDNARTHLSEDDIVRYRGRDMPPTELLAADSHLALCDICHGRMIGGSF